MLLLTILGTLAGCGPNCQSTCNRIYGDAPNCGIQRGGRTQVELYDRCITECETAMDSPGELDGYDPLVRQGSSEDINIENEKQAAVWMDCIAESDCSRLSSGYCAPIW
ncbi:MAG: hypothetical protein H6739_15880 [Alphaproteobacteria bacterium]|nr:hypothetical protein [Alphaproteobacteria bacterium]